jgi:hypothetical protein
MSFYYQRGSVKTHTPWSRPSRESIAGFLEWAVPYTEAQDLTIWLQGACLRDPASTWDLDIVLLGPCADPPLEQLQLELLDKALNTHNLLLDPYWASDLCQWPLQDVEIKLIYPIIKQSEENSFTVDSRKDPRAELLTEYMVSMNYRNRRLDPKHIKLLQQNNGFKFQQAREWLNCAVN